MIAQPISTIVNTIQENDTDTGHRYEYRKMILIQGIDTNTEKLYSF